MTLLHKAALAWFCFLAMQVLAAPEKPNILFILADDLGYGDVGCYNDRAKVPTPNLDRLAREGMGFSDAHNGRASLQIGALFGDSRTNLWAGTWAGLHRWDGDAFKQVLGAGARSFVVLALCEDRTGNLWASSSLGGVFLITPDGKVRLLGRAEDLDHFYIRGLAVDAGGADLCGGGGSGALPASGGTLRKV